MKLGSISRQLALAAGAMLTSIQAFAEERLPAVTVVGVSESTPAQKNIREAQSDIRAIPGGSAVIDMDVVKQGRVSTWVDTLGLAPGVFVQERFGSDEARISIRGSALSRTYHGFGLRVMQDGIPINYADGFFDMQTVDPAAARYVEVLRGPNATTFASGTLGGAINFVSPTGYDTDGFIGRTEAGSFGYARLQAIAGKVLRPDFDGGAVWDYNLSVNAVSQDGYRDHSAQESQKAVANFGARISRELDSRFFVGAVRSRSQLPGYVTKAQLLTDPTVVQNTAWPDSFQRRDIDAYRVANKTVYTRGDYQIEFVAYAMQHELWHPIQYGFIEQSTNTFGGHLKFMDNSALFGKPNLLTLAYLPDTGTTDGSTHAVAAGYTSGALSTKYEQKAVNHRLLLEDSLRVSDRTRVTTSLQYHWSQREKDVLFGAASSYDLSFSRWLPRVGFVHDLAPQLQLFANASSVFEPPIFDVTSTMAATKAQTGQSYEAGLRGETEFNASRGRIAYDLTVYRANLRNEFQTVCYGCVSATTLNVPRTIHQGIELGLSGVLDRHWEARGVFLYSDFRFDGDATYGNNRMPGFPPVMLRGELLYRWGAGVRPASYAGPTFEWVPTSAPMDNTGSVSNEAYSIFGFKAGGPIDSSWSWFLDARNLADKKYAATTNISANYGGIPGSAYYPGNGRSAYIGLEGKW
jgi:iron complex outermembrane receptor protein